VSAGIAGISRPLDQRRLKLWALERLFWGPFARYRVLLYAVGAIAFVWRRLLVRTTFIAITGSLGKTTAKECLAAILGSRFPTVKSSGNRNSGLGLCVGILRVRPWHRFAVFEVAGAAHNNMLRGAQLVRPDVAVILNVLRTHTTAFPTLEDHAAEKARLLDMLRPGGIAFVNGEDPLVVSISSRPGLRLVSFGASASFDFWADEVTSIWPDRLEFRAHDGSSAQHVETQLIGTHWLGSVLAALAVARHCGISLQDAAPALRSVEPFPARLRAVRLPVGAVVLRDDYNASIDTLDAASRVLEEACAPRRLFVVNDFSDFGANRKKRLRYLAEKAARVSDVALFIGENAGYGRRRAIEAGMRESEVHEFATLDAAADFLRSELRADDLMLLKGRTTDHAARIFFAQLGEVGCWKPYCRKTTLCDDCWELDLRRREH
jgi:UDP-N-acetylmuramoyl-tripeptide--D-alanyl-D-alanine ligase